MSTHMPGFSGIFSGILHNFLLAKIIAASSIRDNYCGQICKSRPHLVESLSGLYTPLILLTGGNSLAIVSSQAISQWQYTINFAHLK